MKNRARNRINSLTLWKKVVSLESSLFLGGGSEKHMQWHEAETWQVTAPNPPKQSSCYWSVPCGHAGMWLACPVTLTLTYKTLVQSPSRVFLYIFKFIYLFVCSVTLLNISGLFPRCREVPWNYGAWRGLLWRATVLQYSWRYTCMAIQCS